MRRKPDTRASFFKVLIQNDFTHLLRLPPMFMQKYGFIQKKVKLRIETGRTWDVKVKAMDDGLFCFKGGWDNFAQDLGLQIGEFIVFLMNGDGYSFDVLVYDTSGCKKEFHGVARNPNFEKMNSPLYFEIVLKRHHTSRVTPRRTFARAAGLMGKEGVEVVGERRGVWVVLDNNLKSDPLRVDLSYGWAAFRKANRLVFGKTYSFEFKPLQNVIKVKEVHI